MLYGLAAVLQASGFDCVAFDPFSFQQDALTAPEVDVSRCQSARRLSARQAEASLRLYLETVTARGDITMPELAKELSAAKGLEVTASALSKCLISCGFSFKKNPQGKRTRSP